MSPDLPAQPSADPVAVFAPSADYAGVVAALLALLLRRKIVTGE